MNIAEQILSEAGQDMKERREVFIQIMNLDRNGSTEYLVSRLISKEESKIVKRYIKFKDSSYLEYQAFKEDSYNGQVYAE